MKENSDAPPPATLQHWDTVSNFESLEVMLLCIGRDPYGTSAELRDLATAFNFGAGRRIKELFGQAVGNGWGWCYNRLSLAAALPRSERITPTFLDVPIGLGSNDLSDTSPDIPVLISIDLEYRYLDMLVEDCDHERFHRLWDKATDRTTASSNETFRRELVAAWLKSVRWSIGYNFSLPTPNTSQNDKIDTAAGGTASKVQPFHSEFLTLLMQASRKFWANADQGDKTSHPTNATVAAWLVTHGFSQTLAKHGATIIRPKWADTGRPLEK